MLRFWKNPKARVLKTGRNAGSSHLDVRDGVQVASLHVRISQSVAPICGAVPVIDNKYGSYSS